MFFPFSGYLTRNKWGTLYSDACSNEIYQISPGGESNLKYKMEFGDRAWPESRKTEFYPFFDELQKFQLDFLHNFYEENEDGWCVDPMIYQDRVKKSINEGAEVRMDPKL